MGFDDDVNNTLDNWERDIMASKQRIKGFNFEREIVKLLKDSGVFLDVKRAPGSDGTNLGLTEDVDLVADGFKIQAKRRKTEPKWMELGNCHFLIHRADRDKPKITLNLELFCELFDDKHTSNDVSESLESKIRQLIITTIEEINNDT